MRTFVIRARQADTRWNTGRVRPGTRGHIEVLAHCIMNAFFLSSGFRNNVEVYLVFDSSATFPHTLHFDGSQGLSIGGFHEEAVLSLIEKAFQHTEPLLKNATRTVAPGLSISGFGFERLMGQLLQTRTAYLLAPKGTPLKTTPLPCDPVFVLSDHLSMPPKSVKGLMRQGLQTISLGKTMLFASQCIVLLHHAMDVE